MNDELWCQLLGSRNQHLGSEHGKNWVLDTAASYYCVIVKEEFGIQDASGIVIGYFSIYYNVKSASIALLNEVLI